MSEITYIETEKGLLDKADVLVNITKDIPITPGIEKFSKINVYGTKTGNNGDLTGVEISNTDTEKIAKVTEGTELNFIGRINLWNVATLKQEHVDSMADYGETLVVLSGKVSEIKSNSASLNFRDMVVFLVETATTTTLKDIVKLPNRGAFLDAEKKGKALYSITKLLENPRRIRFTTKIKSSTFKGIATRETAKSLDELGYSYYFKTQNDCWAAGFWIGGESARVSYMRRAIAFDVRTRLASLIENGLLFNKNGYILLKQATTSLLSTHPYVDEIEKIEIPIPADAEKHTGILSGFVIEVTIEAEVRRIDILLKGGI